MSQICSFLLAITVENNFKIFFESCITLCGVSFANMISNVLFFFTKTARINHKKRPNENNFIIKNKTCIIL